jgi:hypothetical protein
MLKRFVCAAILTVAVVGLAMAEDFRGQLYYKDGDAYFKKNLGKKKFGDPVKVTFEKDAKVIFGKVTFDKATKSVTIDEGDAVPDGLGNDAIKKATEDAPANVVLTTKDDKGADNPKMPVTRLVLVKGKKGAN